ncbi:MAG: ubiquinone/menaquinone biosynthesis methyltransferase [bacterium]
MNKDASVPLPDGEAIQKLFEKIAPRYDFFNHLLSGGLDIYWRRMLVQETMRHAPQRILDMGTGSGDVALALMKAGGQVLGADFSAPMLERARAKGVKELVLADAMNLPFADASFDAITLAFSLRNWADRLKGLREMRRVLCVGGRLHVLEFSQPWKILKPFYRLYLNYAVPCLTHLVGHCAEPYHYLSSSVQSFPSQHKLCDMLREAGFREVSYRNLTGGVVALHQGLA